MLAYVEFSKGYYRKRGKPTREHGLIVEICRSIKHLYGRSPANEFGPIALKSVRQTLIDHGNSRKHINKQIDRVKRMFRWAAAEEIISSRIPEALSMVAGLRKGRTKAKETPPVLPVSEDVIAATLEHLSTIVADMVRLQRLTGMRPEEVCALRPYELDRDDEIWQYRPKDHKTDHRDHVRIVYIGPKGQGILLSYLARGDEMFCFRPCDTEEKRRKARSIARVISIEQGNRPGTNRKANPKRKPGECYTTDSYRRAIHRACDKAFPHPQLGYMMRSNFSNEQRKKLKKWQSEHRWSPNRLRHSAATETRKLFGLEGAQVQLGHKQANVTQIYAERDAALGTRIAAEIG